MFEAYDPFTDLICEMEDEIETELAKLLKEFTGEIVDVQYLYLKGSLHGLIDGKPLVATIQMLLGGVQRRFTLQFTVGDGLKFLDALWEGVEQLMKEIFDIVV